MNSPGTKKPGCPPSKKLPGSENGFTLVEIAVAVAILGAALTTLIVLNTRMLEIYRQEHFRAQAGFYAQYLMTLIEVSPTVPEIEKTDGDLKDRLREVGYFDEDPQLEQDQSLEGWRYALNVSQVDLPLLEDALRRIDLEIAWGEGEEENFTVTLFVNSEPDRQTGNPLGGGGAFGEPT